jgi:hypothetical protein
MSLPIELAADLTLNVRNVNRAQRDVEKAVGTGATRGLTKAIRDTQKLARTEYSKAHEDALRVGYKVEAALLKGKWKANLGYLKNAQKELTKLDKAIAKEKDKEAKKRLKAQRKDIESNLKLEQAGMRRLISERASAQEDQLKLLDKGMEKAARSLTEKAEDAGEKFSDLVSKALTGGGADGGEFVKSIAAGIKKAAPSMMSGGKAAVAKGGDMGGSMGTAVAGLGKAAMGLAGAAAGIAAVVAILAVFVAVGAAAVNQTKVWNKAILQGVSGFDAFNASGGSVSNTLEDIRDAASRVSRAWSTAGEEIIASMNAFHQQGLTIGEMKAFTGAARQVDAYTQVMAFAQVQTRALGMETGELAQLTNRMYEQYGYGIKEMGDQMAHFGGAALLAGMNTRSFVAAVMEAGANMALYNFRLEDTSELLIGLTKILGEDLAKQTIGMEGTFRNMGTEGRYKSARTGGKVLGNVIDVTATRQLVGTFTDMTQAQKQIMREAGLLGSTAGFGEEKVKIADIDLEKLGSLSGIEVGAIMNKMDKAGSNMTNFETLTDLAAGIGGTHLERADALAELDRSGEIAAQVAQAMGVLGFQDFETGLDGKKLGVGERRAIEELTGLQNEQQKVVGAIFNRVGARMQADAPDKYGPGGPGYAEIAEEIGGGSEYMSEDMEKKLEEASAPALDIATQQLHATETLGDILSTNIAGLLNWIGGGITNMADLFRTIIPDLNDDAEELAASLEREKALSDELATQKGEVRELERTPGAKTEDIDKARADLERLGAEQVAEQNFQRDLRGGASVEEASLNKLNDLYGNLGGRLQELVQSEDTDMVGVLGTHSLTTEVAEGRITGSEALDTLDADRLRALEKLLAAQDKANDEAATAKETRKAELGVAEDAAAVAEADQVALQALTKTGDAASEAKLAELKQASAAAQTTYDELLTESRKQTHIDLLKSVLGPDGSEDLIRRMTAGETLSAEEKKRLKQQGLLRSATSLNPEGSAEDFLYTGDANGGMITHIDDKDSFFGAKPGGAIDRLGGGGRSIVISNLTINESGNPQKTLAMVKRALRAAEQA